MTEHHVITLQAPAPAVSFQVDRSHRFQGGQVELRRYRWARPLEQTIQALDDSLVVNLAVTSRPASTRVNLLDPETEPLVTEAGRMLIMMPGMTYRLAAPAGMLCSLHLSIRCERLEELAGKAIDWADLVQFGGHPRAGVGIESLLNRMHEELLSDSLGRTAAIQACADLICVELLRRFRRGGKSQPRFHQGGLAPWRMSLILDRVQADAPAPRLAELAALCGLTERQLGRAFKAETGTTIGRFVDDVTMERAHRLLVETRWTLEEIAVSLGFASGDSFAQSFRRVTGIAPGKIRHSGASSS